MGSGAGFLVRKRLGSIEVRSFEGWGGNHDGRGGRIEGLDVGVWDGSEGRRGAVTGRELTSRCVGNRDSRVKLLACEVQELP